MGRGVTFGAGLSPLFLLLGAGLLLRCVEAVATVGSWPPRVSHRASTDFTMAAAIPWAPAPTISLMDGGRRIRNIERKRSLSLSSWRDMLFELSHEKTGIKALHFHGKAKQFKVRLPCTLSKLSKQRIFQKVKWLSRVVTDVKGIQNVPEDLLEQAGKGVGILKFL